MTGGSLRTKVCGSLHGTKGDRPKMTVSAYLAPGGHPNAPTCGHPKPLHLSWPEARPGPWIPRRDVTLAPHPQPAKDVALLTPCLWKAHLGGNPL
jgi:hypothetical protein